MEGGQGAFQQKQNRQKPWDGGGGEVPVYSRSWKKIAKFEQGKLKESRIPDEVGKVHTIQLLKDHVW